MKRLIVRQHAEGEVEYTRKCVLLVTDDVKQKDIDDEVIERLLGEEGVGWEIDDFSGYSSQGHKIEGEASDGDLVRLPVIRYPASAKHNPA